MAEEPAHCKLQERQYRHSALLASLSEEPRDVAEQESDRSRLASFARRDDEIS